MGVGVASTICGIPSRTALLISWIISCILFFVTFIIGILLIVGTFGNAHSKVLEIMNCDAPGSAVSCARVYGFRAEGVVVVILSFFILVWAVFFGITFVISSRRGPAQPLHQGGLVLRPTRSHTAQFATSEA